jgi:hypothetical protein
VSPSCCWTTWQRDGRCGRSSGLWLRRSFRSVFRPQKNATQISVAVGAEVFSLAREKFEKYGLRAARKPCNFSKIEIPYQNPVVQRSRERPLRERACDALLGREGAELRCKRPAKRGDFRHVISVERKLATMQLAEGVELGSNILQVSPRNQARTQCSAVDPASRLSSRALLMPDFWPALASLPPGM